MFSSENRSLTKTEEIVKNYLVTTWFSAKEIAEKLGKSHGTVKNQIHSIYKKLGITGEGADSARLLLVIKHYQNEKVA